MRNLILLVLGIAIGAIGAANAVNILRQRDAYPRGLMDVMQHHYAAIGMQVRERQCGQTISSHLLVMRTLAVEIESAVYGAHTPEDGFRKDAQRLRKSLAAFPGANPPANCAGLAPALKRIGHACDACHQAYR